jgi:hypothetical protein
MEGNVMRKSVIAAAVLALSSTAAFASQNPNVSNSSPYAIGAYDVNARAGIGSGFDTAVGPGKVVGVILTPLTIVPVVVNNIAH